MIHNHIISSLKSKYGQEESEWWFKIGSNIRTKAMQKADSEGKNKDFEKYLTLIELKAIIEEHWTIFEDTYSLDSSPNDKKSKKLAWFTKLNNIRNKVSHTIKNPKGVSDEELEFIKHINSELLTRITKSE